jgi:hypothetical protein
MRHYFGSPLIALMMEAVSTSETSINDQTAQRNIPEDSNLHTNNIRDSNMKRLDTEEI